MYEAKAGKEADKLWWRRKHPWTRMNELMRFRSSAFNASYISGAGTPAFAMVPGEPDA